MTRLGSPLRDVRSAYLLAGVVAGLVYLNALANGFAYDDIHIVENNTAIHQLETLPEALVTPYWPTMHGRELGLWRPVTTALFGRIWCGFACPQTVFMEGVFRRVERWIEGPRIQRLRRNFGPLTAGKFWRKTLKHLSFVVLSALAAHVFTSYFIPVRELIPALLAGPSGHQAAFIWSLSPSRDPIRSGWFTATSGSTTGRR